MKSILSLRLIAFICFISAGQIALSQPSDRSIPSSFSAGYKLSAPDCITLAAPSLEKYSTPYNGKNGTYVETGIGISADAGIKNAGTWTDLADGSKLWRLTLRAPGAYSLAVLYDRFMLPEGGKLWLYNASRSQVIGAFTQSNNPANGQFSTELIQGEEVTLEYLQPAGNDELPDIHIHELAYNYVPMTMLQRYDVSHSEKSTGWGNSASCHVNVNCSPEGDSWQLQKRGVAEIYLKNGSSYGWCSGTLINTTAQNGTPYFLTADHCGGDAPTSDFSYWQFYFGYEATGCSTPGTEPSYNTLTGCQLKADGPISGGSDFLLLLLNTTPPASYNPIYNGWDRSTNGSSSGVGIHHPYGDIKKVSTYTSSLVTGNYTGCIPSAHWRVVWTSTSNGWGVTEGGSSGSPIFNSAGRQIGTLTGGSSYCTATSSPDYYGKMSVHWDQNGSAASQKLQPWLDPGNTGATTTEMYDPNGGQINVCDFYSNIGNDEYFTYYTFNGQWGYWTGQNQYGWNEFAEEYSGLSSTWVHGVKFAVAKAHAGSTGSQLTINIYENNSGQPGALLSSCYVNIADITVQYWNYVQLPSPVETDGSFFVAYQINYTSPADTFALYQAHDRTDGGVNTAWYKDGSSWHPYTYAGLRTSLGVDTRVCSSEQSAGSYVYLSPIHNIQSVPAVLSNKTDISIYPNPANDRVNIDFGALNQSNYKVSIRDLSGKLVKVHVGSSFSGSETSVGIQNLDAGIYFVHVEMDGQKSVIKKLTVIR